jgi:formylglycine-generating enzyme required for sulfatase activity
MINTARITATAMAAALLCAPASAVTIDWVTIPGVETPNACDPQVFGCFGAVDYDYQISKYEVTNTQYAGFLNVVDPTGANGLALYSAFMGSDSRGGINFVGGNPNGSKYVVKSGSASKPVNDVSFYDSLRFANWLHNGQGGGSTETGAYTLLGGTPTPSNGLTVTRNADATIFLTSEDEWHKAAYYDASTLSYNPYPFADGFNSAACEAAPGTTSHSANCGNASAPLTEGGAYTGSPSEYGTFDQGGNVFEWNETITTFIGDFDRGLRGGAYNNPPDNLAASVWFAASPSSEGSILGFRVARLPEPTTALLLACGLLGMGVRRRLH